MLATRSEAKLIDGEANVTMSREEALATFDAAARRYLKMSGAEFLRKWNSGFFKDKQQLATKVDAVSILLPLVER